MTSCWAGVSSGVDVVARLRLEGPEVAEELEDG